MDGIVSFINFVKENCHETTHLCPCRRCRMHKGRISLNEIFSHLISKGMMVDYTNWTSHGEGRNAPSVYMMRQQYIMERRQQQQQDQGDFMNNPTMEILDDAFPLRHMIGVNDNSGDDDAIHDFDDVGAKAAYEKYQRLIAKAKTPLYDGSNKTVLDAILKGMQIKVRNGWSDTSFDEHLSHTKELLPMGNNLPETYREVKKILKNIGMGYKTIHACEYGCVLFYKEFEDCITCPICSEPRYEDGSKVPKKVVKYFPLTPRLQRLYMSPLVAKEMRWHANRDDKDDYMRHPSDGEAWNDFNEEFPDFSREIRNVRLGLATDGFNPFGVAGLSHSTWPIVVVPYNLPPSMCMKKEFNILAMLICGPNSPRKCLNVFMRPLIDELKMLWNTGVVTFDRHDGSLFRMKAAVIWTISDFPGLGMLGGLKTKGYKACPICLDGVDAEYCARRIAYQGHRRWLEVSHPWRKAADRFDGTIESRCPPSMLTGAETLALIDSHTFPIQSLHPKFNVTRSTERLCWTHKSIFYELPYWKSLKQPYSLDVMHIEKNVFSNIIGTILDIKGKSKDAREGLVKQGVRRHLWDKNKGTQARYTVSPHQRVEILEWIKEAKYPTGYAGSLKSKVNLDEKKFNGLKTHDCHVMFQRLLPIVIRPYLPCGVVGPLIALSQWFQLLCCRELKKDDIIRLRDDIVLILCKLERIFPPAFFTIMVHLLIHLPEQVRLKGPVHFNWMYPIER